jgi:hypothetical protein
MTLEGRTKEIRGMNKGNYPLRRTTCIFWKRAIQVQDVFWGFSIIGTTFETRMYA